MKRHWPSRSDPVVLLLGWLALALLEVVAGTGLPFGSSVLGALVVVVAFAGLGWLHVRLAPRLRLPVHPATPALLYAGAALLLAWMRDVMGQESLPGLLGRLLVFGAICMGFVGIARRLPRQPGSQRLIGLVAGVCAAGAVAGHHALALWLQPVGTFSATATVLAPRLLLGVAFLAVLGFGLPRRQALVAACAALLALAAAVPRGSGSPGPASRPSVVLLSVDTLRADDAENLSSVQRLAARGERFVDAVSSAPWTLPAVASMTTGLYPHRHGAGRQGLEWLRVQRIEPGTPSLAERLGDAGYASAAVVTNHWLVPGLGFEEGFGHWDHVGDLPIGAPLLLDAMGRRGDLARRRSDPADAANRVDRALAWLDRRPEGPFFLWLHLMDPHLPYWHAELPEPLRQAYGPGGGAELLTPAIRRGEFRPAPGTDAALHAAYRQEVAYTDHEIGRFLDGLDARGLLDGAIVAFTSDHGEEFWEHGRFGHGHAMSPEVLRVPLVLVRPGGPAGTIRTDPASLVDVMPTLLAAAGLSVPTGLDGRDLTRPVPPTRTRLAENTIHFEDRRALLTQRFVLDQSFRGVALYDVAKDPGWQRDLADAHPEAAARLVEHLADSEGRRAGTLGKVDLEALAALGYVER
jgi:arylsulfatase